ncbi:putative ssDNA-binding protein [Pseudomonas phage gh-1]|uniref:Single-stranded DNA-binding protein n=10 Tax=Ghunavirus TaxID=2732683 RepID=A0A1W6JRW5_9CAUD|nr:single-stranded DNA-binding protein [Pseudomonas phage gh-1]YP_009043245.1 single-stranded DNA-binding protein [Pseudomonas phage phiPSA2]YP_009784763.1 ssDNA-binding protein [Pseudomonas phage phiPsa17]YP_009790454.1 single-stranded DNA-binding protein [Pseudomonas phage WRT]QHB47886.1 single-stranded DNA-binding protein [Pseudomonas phage CHF1]QHB47933.1 single-stranded DNA-binding protein [Pseudomonas phage CHF7]QHB47981.1 single-stranded DNA-binding protein [Pseudomonas phage CHF19]QH
MAKSTKQFLFTPVGTAEPYCSIQKPDFGNPEKGFGNPRGVYKVSLTIPSREAQPLIDKITKAYDKNWAEISEAWENGGRAAAQAKLARGKKLLEAYQGELPFFENEDGTVTFKFSGYASYKDQKTGENRDIVLRVVDAKGKRIEAVPAIAGGSKLKVRFSIFPYTFGAVVGASVKLQLDSVMLIELREFAAGGDDWAGQEEEGFEAPDDREEGWRGEQGEEDEDSNQYGSGDF